MRIGIFFGGTSREREISFAGGRTVFDNLDKGLFQPVPIFVDSQGHFILLDWQYLYKGTIRDFYPPVAALSDTRHPWQVYIESLGELSPAALTELISHVGRQVEASELPQFMDFAFLALHGPGGEDGAIQGLLEWVGIPYSGSGILPSAIGIDKIAQKKLMQAAGLPTPKFRVLSEKEASESHTLMTLRHSLGLPLVVKAPRQGSSIGVSIVRNDDKAEFHKAVDRALFRRTLLQADWNELDEAARLTWVRQLADIREGIGLPVKANALMWNQNSGNAMPELLEHPEALYDFINRHFAQPNSFIGDNAIELQSLTGESQVLVEQFVAGREFSCIVVEDANGQPLALPPTEIVKGTEVFDYRAKYLPGLARKVTPIDLPEADIERIRQEAQKMFATFGFEVYARLDGFIQEDGTIFLNDPNTTSGMLPASFFFHQAAEIGLNPSQFLTYIIRTSLNARRRGGMKPVQLGAALAKLDADIQSRQQVADDRIRVAVIMGGYSSERHISVESGRNIYEKLSSSVKYRPVPVFLAGNSEEFRLYELPINVMLKDNADDIREKIEHAEAGEASHPVLARIRQEASGITGTYAGQPVAAPRRISFAELAEKVDEVFIALHGRPGEDGALQQELEKFGLPYNGSGAASSAVTINKFETNRRLREAGLRVADHRLAQRLEWAADPEAFYRSLESQFGYPFIAKPADDGCSSAVKKIKNRAELAAFSEQIFRREEPLLVGPAEVLHLGFKEEFPQKDAFLVETLIGPNGAAKFLEITGGLLTSYDAQGQLQIEVFEASEALATGEVLSLEEKFLAGEGQNITPARYAQDPAERQRISEEVKRVLRQVAEILHIEGYARIDAFVRVRPAGAIEVLIIEVNSLPGMTPATCIFHQTALAGYTPYQFIDRILDFGKARAERATATSN
ncbi:D-alanine--D-alanine ligase family protein [Hymenobacter cheonanensis]|uniref:D-alanine--D-alanine ligase family protein n=1 Tax=Hymenobacter sp. CA2-7 TaxID=3063993 RepID=UPI00271352A5|nr:D-alanine--D-alanine ligase [Hymenobacter sp. CA2-7]MDO7884321.1 D-alanine--D-alanine ligase [Hymenobacter sp. CA2-7]